MTNSHFVGERIRLGRLTDDHMPQLAEWLSDFGLQRLVNPGTVVPHTAQDLLDPNGWMAADRNNPNNFMWVVYTFNDDTFLGVVALILQNSQTREYEIGINIANPDYRSKGYGGDIMLTAMRFGFTQMNAHRIWLGVFGYNTRGIRLYTKLGFQLEATERQTLYRDGVYHDQLYMGMLKQEWEARYGNG